MCKRGACTMKEFIKNNFWRIVLILWCIYWVIHIIIHKEAVFGL